MDNKFLSSNKIDYVNCLNKIMSGWLESGEKIVLFENTEGGIANKVLKLTTNYNNKYIFKIYKKIRNQTLPFELMKYLKNNNINVAFPLNEKPIMFENTECYLYDYIEHTTSFISDELEQFLMKLLKIISEFNTKIDNEEYFYKSKCDREFELLKNKKHYKLNEKIIANVLDEYQKVRNLPINNKKEVVHSDISTSNLLKTDRGYCLIDFDEVRFTSKIYDLCVILVKFFFNGREIDFNGARKFALKYLEVFREYDSMDCYNVFVYYVVKQLLEKFSDYEIFNIDIYSEQQQRDDFRNWIYYFENLELIKKIFF